MISILDVGHGNSVVVEDSGEVIVIDAGRRNELLDFLDAAKINSVELVLVSHADADHIGGLIGLLASEEVAVKRLVVNGDGRKDTDLWDDLLHEADRLRQVGTLEFTVGLMSGTSFSAGQIDVKVVAPTPYLAGKAVGGKDRQGKTIGHNSMSAAFLVRSGDTPLVLCAGDIDRIGLDSLLDEFNNGLHARLLVFPHHGGLPGSANIENFVEDLCQAVQPEVIIFSIGRGVHGTPNPDVVTQARRSMPSARILCTQLSEHCVEDLGTIQCPTHLAKCHSAGAFHKKCCAGTITVRVDTDRMDLLPDGTEHSAFIETFASSALCRRELSNQ